jgi:ParB/RepB/Spo0J family partition protein
MKANSKTPFADAAAEAVQMIPLDRITESVNNPRKTYSEATLQEMADSIRSQGVLQPIVVREIAGSLYRYEIVFGHRRYRGSIRADLEEIPAIVRVMTDEQADQARLHENLEREDVHFIEEAEAMLRLMSKHGVTAQQLMEQTGKKSTYVYGRLKLAGMHSEVRAKCLEGVFTAEVATLIARWPAAVQPKAMQACLLDHYGLDPAEKGKHAKSYRDCKLALRNIAIPIARADFDPADHSLPILTPGALTGKASATGACTDCPDNTANDVAMAEHLGTEEAHCLFRACFETREATSELREVEVARADGRVVDVAVASRQPDLIDDRRWQGSDSVARIVTLAREKGLEVPLPTLILSGDNVNGRMYPKAAVTEIRAQLFPDIATRAAGPESADHHPDPMAGLSPVQRAVCDGAAWRLVIRAILAKVRTLPRTVEDLRLLALTELEFAGDLGLETEQAFGWPVKDDDFGTGRRAELINQMSAADLGALMVMSRIETVSAVHGGHGSDPETRQKLIDENLALAARFGVDVLAAIQPEPATEEAAA